MCDVSYVLILGYVERRVIADRQSAAALGVAAEEWPTFEQAQDNFDALINSEPVPDDPRMALLRRLGVS